MCSRLDPWPWVNERSGEAGARLLAKKQSMVKEVVVDEEVIA